MNLDNIFNTPIFYDTLNYKSKDLEDFCSRLYGMSDGRKKSNKLGWQSEDVQNEEELQNLIILINEKLKQIHSYSNLKNNCKLVVDNIWININSKYSYNDKHIHFKSFYSGVYYLQVPENSGNIQFTNPSNLQRIFIEVYKNYIQNFNGFTAQNWVFKPQKDLLLLFPSWIEHSVNQNLSNENRISIAFNTTIK